MRWVILVVAVGVASLAVSAGSASPSKRWAVTDLGTLRRGSANAVSINERGQIVGDVSFETGTDSAFLWENGKMRELVGMHGGVRKVNLRGDVLATFSVGGRDRSFVWRSGNLTDLRSMVASDINDHGQVVGRITRRNGTFEAVRWERGQIVALGTLPGDTGSSAAAINDQGQIVGTSWGALNAVRGRERVFQWENGSMSDLGSLTRNAARGTVDVLGINERGDVAGDQVVSYNTRHCFLWRDGRMADLGTLGGRFCKVTGLNDRGQVIGWSRLKRGPGEQPESAVFVSANGRLTPVAPGMGILTSINNHGQIALDAAVWEGGTITALPGIGHGFVLAEAINDRGQIVGGTLAPDGDDHALLWTPVNG